MLVLNQMKILRPFHFFVLTLTTATTLNLISGGAKALQTNQENLSPDQKLLVKNRIVLLAQNSTNSPTKPEDKTSTVPTPKAGTTPSPATTPSIQPATLPQNNSNSQEATEPRVLVSEVTVTGVDEQLKDLIYRTIQTLPGKTANRSQIQQDVTAIYNLGLFSNVKVTPQDTPLGVRIVFDVQANPILRQVKLDIVPASDKNYIFPSKLLNDIFNDQYGKIINTKDLQTGIKKINEWYSKNGYELAQVLGSPKISEDGTVKLTVSQGDIENIDVKFFTKDQKPLKHGKTRDFIVTREMQLKPGVLFNRNTAQQDLQRVYGLGIFQDVKLSFTPGKDPAKVVISVDVVEGKAGSVGAGAGFSSEAGVFGTVSYQDQNIGGNDQTLGLQFQGSFQQLLFNLSFTDPWIATLPNRVSYTVNLFRSNSLSLVYTGNNSSLVTANGISDPQIVRTGLGLNFGIPLSKDPFTNPTWRLSTGFNVQQVQSQDSNGNIQAQSLPLNGYPAYSSGSYPYFTASSSGTDYMLLLNFSASRDLRNNPLQPSSGSALRLSLEQAVPITGGIDFTRVRANYSVYFPLKLLKFDFIPPGPQVLAFNFQAGAMAGSFPGYEAFVVGGSNSVRGYPDGEVGSGKYYGQFTAEYRFPIYSIVGGAIFFDYGTTFSSMNQVPGSPGLARCLPGSGYGYGIGVRIQSPVGNIRVDYGIPQSTPACLGLSSGGRIQFGIGERF